MVLQWNSDVVYYILDFMAQQTLAFFKINKTSTWKRHKLCSKLIITSSERRQQRHFGVTSTTSPCSGVSFADSEKVNVCQEFIGQEQTLLFNW